MERLRSIARHNEEVALCQAREEEREKWQDIITSKDAEIANIDSIIASKDAIIASKDEEIIDKDAEIARLREQLENKGTAYNKF